MKQIMGSAKKYSEDERNWSIGRCFHVALFEKALDTSGLDIK